MADVSLFQPQYGFGDSITSGYLENKRKKEQLEEGKRQFDLSYLIDQGRLGVNQRQVGLGEQQYADTLNQRDQLQRYLAEQGITTGTTSEVGMQDALSRAARQQEFQNRSKENRQAGMLNFRAQRALDRSRRVPEQKGINLGNINDLVKTMFASGTMSPQDMEEYTMAQTQGPEAVTNFFTNRQEERAKAQFAKNLMTNQLAGQGQPQMPATAGDTNQLRISGGGGLTFVMDRETGEYMFETPSGERVKPTPELSRQFGLIPELGAMGATAANMLRRGITKPIGAALFGSEATQQALATNSPFPPNNLSKTLEVIKNTPGYSEIYQNYLRRADGNEAMAMQMMVEELNPYIGREPQDGRTNR